MRFGVAMDGVLGDVVVGPAVGTVDTVVCGVGVGLLLGSEMGVKLNFIKLLLFTTLAVPPHHGTQPLLAALPPIMLARIVASLWLSFLQGQVALVCLVP